MAHACECTSGLTSYRPRGRFPRARVLDPDPNRISPALGYALHVNANELEASAQRPDRQAKFEHIAAQKAAFAEAGQPIISVDTKKKELIGNFKNGGATWSREAAAVNVHDFLQDALGRAVPYNAAPCGPRDSKLTTA